MDFSHPLLTDLKYFLQISSDSEREWSAVIVRTRKDLNFPPFIWDDKTFKARVKDLNIGDELSTLEDFYKNYPTDVKTSFLKKLKDEDAALYIGPAHLEDRALPADFREDFRLLIKHEIIDDQRGMVVDARKPWLPPRANQQTVFPRNENRQTNVAQKQPEVVELSDDEEEAKAFKRARPDDEVEETIKSVVAKVASKETAAKVGKSIKCVADHVPIEIRFDPNVTEVTVSDVVEYSK